MIINESEWPLSVQSIAKELREIGVERGMTLIVHTSVKSFNRWIIGGVPAMILALEEAIGEEGTLVMPAQSPELSDPSRWMNPPVPHTWWQTIIDEMPPFQKDLTPTSGMGAVAECFRKQAGTLRSNHPQTSFCARGPKAYWLTEQHALAYRLGEQSPLARLYEDQAMILLLGVGHDSNTSIHLAEYRANYKTKAIVADGAPIREDGVRKWVAFEDVDIASDDFDAIGKAFERDCAELVRSGYIGEAKVKLLPMRSIVDYAVPWLERHR